MSDDDAVAGRPSRAGEVSPWPILACLLLLMCAIGWSTPAPAIPAFAQQTGQPCSQCHVGALGPQLKPFARDFKLLGYVEADGLNHLPPIAVLGQTSFTHTGADQGRPPAAHFAADDNFAVDQLNLDYGGRLIGGAGGFIEFTYNGTQETFTADNVDVRRAAEATFKGRDIVIGLDFNNAPTVQDLWNSTPVWGFPFSASALAPTPANVTLIDGKLAHRVVGGGVYSMWNDLLYTEFTAYAPIDNNSLSRMGVATPVGSDVYSGVIPYWRVALQHDFADFHVVEIGAFGIAAARFPAGERAAGADRITDIAFDATYQYTGDPGHFVSAHATWIHEAETLAASRVLSRTHASDHLDTLRADVSYSFDNTWTPTAQVFETFGSRDRAFFGGASGSPDSAGYVVELAYVPWGKPGSPVHWANARYAIQYVGYTRFNGETRAAARNNTLFLSSRFAFAPFGAFVKR